MNQLVEVWKEIPDFSDEISSSPEQQSSPKGTKFSVIFSFVFGIFYKWMSGPAYAYLD